MQVVKTYDGAPIEFMPILHNTFAAGKQTCVSQWQPSGRHRKLAANDQTVYNQRHLPRLLNEGTHNHWRIHRCEELERGVWSYG